jgi:hypothetical protein
MWPPLHAHVHMTHTCTAPPRRWERRRGGARKHFGTALKPLDQPLTNPATETGSMLACEGDHCLGKQWDRGDNHVVAQRWVYVHRWC